MVGAWRQRAGVVALAPRAVAAVVGHGLAEVCDESASFAAVVRGEVEDLIEALDVAGFAGGETGGGAGDERVYIRRTGENAIAKSHAGGDQGEVAFFGEIVYGGNEARAIF